ncbi:transporter [Asticcacaulis sp. AC466]|uniref:AEC family transporter n=1 Tax=Asticcacaulis sp. AC466 TaxID=1282362 RepID=UPI0003C3C1D3|nr:AEC family transporter [Asticcacaulis sp. AC466]ESQ84109.1 transporter [Asticcacaulis sp. AC466]
MAPNLILNGIVPVFLLIALGYALKKSGFLPLNVWPPIEKFAVYVLYPGFLIPAIWHADLSGFSTGPISVAVVGSVVIAAAVGFALKPFLRLSGPTFTSVFQGLMRFNSFIFVPVAASIFGPSANGLSAVAISALIPASNMICILVLAQWGEPEGEVPVRTPAWFARTLLTNPIFASCLVGLLLNFLRVPSLPFVEKSLTMLGEAAIPTGLILAGVGLSFGYVWRRPFLVGAVSLFKVLVMPVMAWAICYGLGGDRMAQGIALACGAAPCAAAAYVQARHMGGDAPLMAGIVALTTSLSAFTMPLLLFMFHLV